MNITNKYVIECSKVYVQQNMENLDFFFFWRGFAEWLKTRLKSIGDLFAWIGVIFQVKNISEFLDLLGREIEMR